MNTEKLWIVKLLKNCLNIKLAIFLKTFAKMVKIASNHTMAQKLKLLNGLIHQILWCCHMTNKVSLPS